MGNSDITEKATKYLILIPFIITIACAMLEWWAAFDSGQYKEYNWIEHIGQISRIIIGYLFPSIISLIISMIFQRSILKDSNSIGICEDKTFSATIITFFYVLAFVFYLIDYSIGMALIFILASIFYVMIINGKCLDPRIRITRVNKEKYLNAPNR